MINDHSIMPTAPTNLPVKNSKHQAEADTLPEKPVEIGWPQRPRAYPLW